MNVATLLYISVESMRNIIDKPSIVTIKHSSFFLTFGPCCIISSKWKMFFQCNLQCRSQISNWNFRVCIFRSHISVVLLEKNGRPVFKKFLNRPVKNSRPVPDRAGPAGYRCWFISAASRTRVYSIVFNLISTDIY